MGKIAKVTREQAIREFWRRGSLKYKLHRGQVDIYDDIRQLNRNEIAIFLISRQFGKSVLLCILALEQALKQPNSIVKILTDTKTHARSIFEPIFVKMLEDCPEDFKPEFIRNEYAYKFYNGSQIQIAGSDNKHYERLRGQNSSLVLIDEAGFCSNLTDAVKSVLIPTLTHSGGNIIMASTPPSDPEHEFHSFIEEAEMNGRLFKKTVYDNPLLTREQIDNITKQQGGVHSPQFRREYLCEILRNEDRLVFPEFDTELENSIKKDWPLPPYYDSYVGMDLGGKDFTAVVFGYYDFRSDKIIIQDELLFDFRIKDNTIKTLADAILKKEEALYTNPYTHEIQPPFIRVSDINYIVTQELFNQSYGKLNFVIPKKDVKEAAVNNLRVLLNAGKIIISPKCEVLLRHIRNCKWNDKKDGFLRSPENGHYDMVDALQYLVRSVVTSKNPYPNGYTLNLRSQDSYARPGISLGKTDQYEVYKKIFNVKKRR